MYSFDHVQKQAIQWHYDLSTVFYRFLWGSHIHHGLWSGCETPSAAQRNLTETLAAMAQITRGQRVLDVGCGMGGSSIHLAQRLHCQVTGVTLSPVQRVWANVAALWSRVASRTDFLCQDIEKASFDHEAFDVVWSIECTEHLFDKPAFFQQAAKWLRPGGRVAICAWLTKDGALTDIDQQLLQDVCRGMLCPSLGSTGDYCSWMKSAGLKVVEVHDWTNRVQRTWEICRARVERIRLRSLARWFDREAVDFLDRFQTMLDAYASGTMRYGCLIAEKQR